MPLKQFRQSHRGNIRLPVACLSVYLLFLIMVNLTNLYLETSIQPESVLSRRHTLNCLLILPIKGSSPLTLNATDMKRVEFLYC